MTEPTEPTERSEPAGTAEPTERSVPAGTASGLGGPGSPGDDLTGDDLTVVVLAGGSARRFGADKLAAPIQGSTVLDHLLDRLPGRWPVVVVGSTRSTVRTVRWAREEPPGGGPLAGVAAGLAAVRTPLVAVVAGDMPHAARALVALASTLRSADPEVAGVVGVDETGSANPLLGVYRTCLVREQIPHPAHGVAAKRLLDLPHLEVTVAGLPGRDVDTVEDLAEIDRPH